MVIPFRVSGKRGRVSPESLLTPTAVSEELNNDSKSVHEMLDDSDSLVRFDVAYCQGRLVSSVNHYDIARRAVIIKTDTIETILSNTLVACRNCSVSMTRDRPRACRK